MMTLAKSITPLAKCSSKPLAIENPVSRESILLTLEQLLTRQNFVILEGAPQSGKTEVLMQFAARHPATTIGAFVSGESRLGRSPEMVLYDIACQMQYLLFPDKPSPGPAVVDQVFLQRLYNEAGQRSIREGSKFFFIIDGLEHVVQSEKHVVQQIIGLLPPPSRHTGVIITQGPTDEVLEVTSLSKFRIQSLTPFNLPQTREFLTHHIELSKEDSERIYEHCGGLPGHLAIISQLLDEDHSVDEVLDAPPRELLHLIRLAWNVPEISAPEFREFLCCVSLGQRLSIAELATCLAGNEKQVREWVRTHWFIVGGTDNAEPVSFVNEAFRRFGKEELNDIYDEVLQKYVTFKLTAENAEELSAIPRLFYETGDYEGVLEFLRDEQLSEIVRDAPSLESVVSVATVGFEAAERSHRIEEVSRFAITVSAFNELGYTKTDRAEIQALVDIGQPDQSLAVARSVRRLEDRIEMLAAYGVAVAKSAPLPTELVDEIAELLAKHTRPLHRTKFRNLAHDLIRIDERLALKLVEKQRERGDSGLDRVLIGLSLQADFFGNNETGSSIFHEQITSPRLRSLLPAIALSFRDDTASGIADRIDSLGSSRDAIYVFRNWLRANQSHLDCTKVLNEALEYAVRSNEYTPNADDYCDFALCLPNLPKTAILDYVARFDAVRESIRDIGPMQDVMRLEYLLAKAEFGVDEDVANNRVIAAYLEVFESSVVANHRAAALAGLAALQREVKSRCQKPDEPLGVSLSEVETELRGCLTDVLAATFDHVRVLKPIINALAEVSPELSVEIAQQANTRDRRDELVHEIIEIHLDQKWARVSWSVIFEAIDSIRDRAVKSSAIATAVDRLVYEDTNQLDKSSQLGRMAHLVEIIVALEHRSLARAQFVSYVLRVYDAPISEKFLPHVEKAKAEWAAIVNPWSKLDFGFAAVSALCEGDRRFGEAFLMEVAQFKTQSPAGGMGPRTIRISADLAVAAAVGMMRTNVWDGVLEERLIALIENPAVSLVDQVGLWTDLSTRLQGGVNPDKGNVYVQNRLHPLLDGLKELDSATYQRCLIIAAPALFRWHRGIARDCIEELEYPARESAIARIHHFITTNAPLPYASEVDLKRARPQSYDWALEMVDLADYTYEDSQLYNLVASVGRNIGGRKSELNSTQKERIESSLRKIIQAKLPNPDFIKHEGYLVLCEGWLKTIRSQHLGSIPSDLLDRGRDIPNLADRAFVLTQLAQMFKCAGDLELFDEIDGLVEAISVESDKTERLLDIADFLSKYKKTRASKYVEKALHLSRGLDYWSAKNARERAVNLAYEIDPGLARKMASDTDDDPIRASEKRKASVEQGKKWLKATQAAPAAPTDFEYLADAAGNLTGSLIEGRAGAINTAGVLPILARCKGVDLTEAHPVYSFAIESIVAKYKQSDTASAHLVPLCAAVLNVAELVERAVSRRGASTGIADREALDKLSNGLRSSVVLGANSRREAEEFIVNWLPNCRDRLLIHDPYFTAEDLALLRLVRGVTNCEVRILTSWQKHLKDVGPPPWDEYYREKWKEFSDDKDAHCWVVVAGVGSSGSSPIKERWWVSGESGIKMGWSWNQIESQKIISISQMDSLEQEKAKTALTKYGVDMHMVHAGQRVRYQPIQI